MGTVAPCRVFPRQRPAASGATYRSSSRPTRSARPTLRSGGWGGDRGSCGSPATDVATEPRSPANPAVLSRSTRRPAATARRKDVTRTEVGKVASRPRRPALVGPERLHPRRDRGRAGDGRLRRRCARDEDRAVIGGQGPTTTEQEPAPADEGEPAARPPPAPAHPPMGRAVWRGPWPGARTAMGRREWGRHHSEVSRGAKAALDP